MMMCLCSLFIAAAALLLLSLLATTTLATTEQSVVTVTNQSGSRIVGLADDESNGVDKFLGIRYARVTERFAKSTPILHYDKDVTINATYFGAWCHQNTGLDYYRSQKASEDCLFLNIWRPSSASAQESPLATMVWIHGGGFVMGSGANPWYDGSRFARNHGVLVVSLNYRLGVLGFLVTDNDGNNGGMNGIHDQVNALHWIQANIAFFGGDPDNVTLFGQSAGSISICVLNVSPLAKGLYRRAIMQSGECVWNKFSFQDEDDAIVDVEALLEETGAQSIEDLKNVTRFPARAFQSLRYVTPTAVDGWVMPHDPKVMYERVTEINPTDLIVGSNSFDDPSLCTADPIDYISMANDLEEEIEYDIQDDDFAERAFDAYSPDRYKSHAEIPIVAAYAQYMGDFDFTCPQRAYAALVSQKIQGNVFLYNFGHLAATDPVFASGLGQTAGIRHNTWASHGSEVSFVFGTFISYQSFTPVGNGMTEEDEALSNEIMSRWTNFAKHGDPNAGSLAASWTPVPRICLSLETNDANATQLEAFRFSAGGGRTESAVDSAARCSALPDFVKPETS